MRELQIPLSHYLFRVREGETIVVADRAKVVARTLGISKIIDLVSERAGSNRRNLQLGMLLDQLWVE